MKWCKPVLATPPESSSAGAPAKEAVHVLTVINETVIRHSGQIGFLCEGMSSSKNFLDKLCPGAVTAGNFFFFLLCHTQDEVDPKRQKTENGSSA